MDVNVVAYDVGGWGVGELWLDANDVVLAHDLPVARASTAARRPHPLVDRILAYFGGSEDSFADVSLDLEGYRAGSANEVLNARLQSGGLRGPRAL